MKNKILIIDDEKEFIVNAFIPKIKYWGLDYDVISNQTFGSIEENMFFDFVKEIEEIILRNKESLEVIFVDLGLNTSEQGPSMGFRLIKKIRELFIDIPIVALTRFEEIEIIEQGYLYDLDRYIKKGNFGNLGSVEFSGIIHLVVKKREAILNRIPLYYQKMIDSLPYTTFQAFGQTFTKESQNMEMVLTDTGKLDGEINSIKEHSVILFADLCNSTAIKLKMGFYEGLNLTRIHNKIITEVIKEFNGDIVKYIGDCVMARFDYKSEADVDYLPINAAILIQEKLKQYNSQYRKNADFKIESKIGISVGKVVNFYGNDPQGPCVDEAARLESLAKPNQILISSELLNLINTSGIKSKVGEGMSRDSNEYVRDSVKVQLKGIGTQKKVHEIFWSDVPLGIDIK